MVHLMGAPAYFVVHFCAQSLSYDKKRIESGTTASYRLFRVLDAQNDASPVNQSFFLSKFELFFFCVEKKIL